MLTSKLFARIQRETAALQDGLKTDTADIINCLRTFGNLLK
jgi:hypothetical protein